MAQPRKAGPIASHYLAMLRDEIRERIEDMNFYRDLAVRWAAFAKGRGEKRTAQAYIQIGEKLGDHILVLEAKITGIGRLMSDDDIDEGWC